MKVFLGISGASGAIYGAMMLKALKSEGCIVDLVISEWAKIALKEESGISAQDLWEDSDAFYDNSSLSSPPASGSYKYDSYIIAPMSMHTAASIAHGLSGSLICRAASVALKERRKLILLPRETPLSSIMLRNLLILSESGAIILPPMPAFYARPETAEDIVAQTVGKALDLMGLSMDGYKRWEGESYV